MNGVPTNTFRLISKFIHAPFMNRKSVLKDLMFRRELKNNQQPTNDNKCRLYKIHVENVTHIIRSCSKMSSRYYLPIWHDVIAKYLYEAIRRSKDPKCKIEYTGNEFIDQDNGSEYWWNVAIKTAVKVRYYSARPCEKFSSLVSADRDI